MSGGLAILLDGCQRQLVLTRVREFPSIEARTFPVERGRTYHLKIMCTGDVVNDLPPNVGDPNCWVPEYKAFLVDIEKI